MQILLYIYTKDYHIVEAIRTLQCMNQEHADEEEMYFLNWEIAHCKTCSILSEDEQVTMFIDG